MRLSVMVLGFVCLCAVVIGIAAPAMQDEDVRGAFLTSRPKEKPRFRHGNQTKQKTTEADSPSPNKTGKPPEKQHRKAGTSGPVSTV